ncbi:MAG: beta-hydroxyacyl-ACP dehydratase, partial [Selenomonadaceae bacterium]|nr:beta-hydroxyacyl-ACP dehydratase [Selenomonadaceae bacterium]
EEKFMTLDAYELQSYEPNRYPFLYIDRVTEVVPGKYAKGYKNFTNNEWFFPLHYVGHPLVPGIIQIETLSQLATIIFTTLPGVSSDGVRGYEIHSKYHREVHPGDRLDIEATAKFYAHGVGKADVISHVDGELACELSVTLLIPSEFNPCRPKKKI